MKIKYKSTAKEGLGKKFLFLIESKKGNSLDYIDVENNEKEDYSKTLFIQE